MELYLIRHGQSTNNALMEDQVLRVYDPELTPIGKQQADCVADHLANGFNKDRLIHYTLNQPERQQPQKFGITHLYCSAMHRALQTAQPISRALGLPVQVWLDIHEHGGIYLEKEGVITGYGGRTRSQIVADFPEYTLPDAITDAGWWNPDSGMEDLAGCQARAIRVAKALHERALNEANRDDHIALVTHGTFMDSLIKALCDNLPSNGYYFNHWNTAITLIEFTKKWGMRLRYTNRIDHLPDHMITG